MSGAARWARGYNASTGHVGTTALSLAQLQGSPIVVPSVRSTWPRARDSAVVMMRRFLGILHERFYLGSNADLPFGLQISNIYWVPKQHPQCKCSSNEAILVSCTSDPVAKCGTLL